MGMLLVEVLERRWQLGQNPCGIAEVHSAQVSDGPCPVIQGAVSPAGLCIAQQCSNSFVVRSSIFGSSTLWRLAAHYPTLLLWRDGRAMRHIKACAAYQYDQDKNNQYFHLQTSDWPAWGASAALEASTLGSTAAVKHADPLCILPARIAAPLHAGLHS